MRRHFRIFAVMSVLALSVSGPSFAADIPAPVYKAPPAVAVAYNWSGFYAGVNVGYGFGNGNVDLGVIDPTGSLQGAAAAGVFPSSYSFIVTAW